MNSIYLSIGSNTGNRREYLKKALQLLESGNDSIGSVSPVYETEPWGVRNQQNFYNLAVELVSELEPAALLEKIHHIEHICGRKRTVELYSPRTLDIDILFYNNLILTTDDLKIPHPLLHSRLFVLVPMGDIAPDFRHPVLGKTIRQLIRKCDDGSKVSKIY